MKWLLAITLLSLQAACATGYERTLGGNIDQVFERTFLSDYETAWAAAIEAIKASQLDIKNREAGILQTKWIDNTAERNFVDSFGTAQAYLKAQYRFRLTVAKGFYNGRPSVKITVYKEQLVQNDALEGWRPTETDAIDENTLLYRIGRIIAIQTRLIELDEARRERELKRLQGDGG